MKSLPARCAARLGIAALLLFVPILALAATPTLVQHLATGMTNNPVTTFSVTLPNPAGAGNALILGVQYKSSGTIASVVDDHGNAWTAGPSVTNSGLGATMRLYYALNVTGGTQRVTVNFSGLAGTPGHAQGVISEFYNVAPVAAIDGAIGSASSSTAGSLNTTADGDLIYQWGAALSNATDSGGTYNGASIVAGSGFTLLSADLQVGSADQYQVQSTAGTIAPAFSASGNSTWGSLALALKSAPSGTPPPPGIRVVHAQYTLFAAPHSQNRTSNTVMQFPSSGNLLVGLMSSVGEQITNITDNAGNSWTTAVAYTNAIGVQTAQIVYAANASTSPALGGINLTLNTTCSYSCFLILYDVSGAAASPLDVTNAAEGISTDDANLTMLSLTPTTSQGLVFNAGSWFWHTATGVVPPATFAAVVNGAENNDSPCCTDSSTLNEDDPYALYYNPDTSPVSFTYSHTVSSGGNVGVSYWVSTGAAFKASVASLPSPGIISLTAPAYGVNEADGSVPITAVRTGGSTGAVGVGYATSDGTALAGSDYLASIGVLSWADGDSTSKTFAVPILNDTIFEGDETFAVSLMNASGGATLGAISTATVTIHDSGVLTIGQTSVLAGQGSGDAGSLQGIKATLSQAATIQSMSIYFRAASGKTRLSIYADASNYPGALKAQTLEFTPVVGWNTQAVTLPVALTAGNYWLIWQTDNNAMGVAYAPVGTNPGIYKSFAYGAPPAAFPSGGSASPDESIYATLSTGAVNGTPAVATAASATPNPVSGATTTLSALGADDGGEANLTYTWATTGTPPAVVTFGANGTNAAKSVLATFTKAGSYSLQVTIKDQGGLSVTSSTTVTVAQTLAGITVSPASASVATGGTQAYTATAVDQFGVALAPQPAFTWVVSGGGTISAAGLFTAGSVAGGPYTVTASSGAMGNTASVTVTAATTITIGQKSVLSGQGSGDASALEGIKATLGQAATIQSMSIYFRAASGKSRLSIYADAGNYPGALMAQTAEFTPVVGWNTQAVTVPAALSAGSYWLIWQTNNNSMGIAYTPGANPGIYKTFTYGVPPATFPTGGSGSPDESIYATLITGPVNAPPTVATAASATPNPVPGATTTLSALGADDGGEANLTYTWATTGTPPAAVTFGANGTNAAKSVLATFTKAGSYTLQVTIRDQGGLSVTSSTTVAVAQTLTGITVSPANASVAAGGTQAYTATAVDQFGVALAPQPAFTWTVSGGGTISAVGLFTAGSVAGGPYTVTATSGAIGGTASVTVTAVNAPPTVATAASATPNPVSGSTTLSALGADDGGEANLTYTWATTGAPPAAVTFTANGTNAAKSTVAIFAKAGSYNLQVTIRDQAGLGVTSSTTVLVVQNVTTIAVTPASVSVATGGTQAFTATAQDQFGAPVTPAPTFAWTVSGGGTISASGLFTAGSVAGGPYTVTASSGAVSGTASVTVTGAAPFTIGNTTVLSLRSSNDANVMLTYKVNLATTAAIQSLSIYTKRTGGRLYLAIYGDNAGYPGALKATTAEFTPVTGWNTQSVTTKVALSPGTYWLVVEPSSNNYGTGYDGAGPANSSYNASRAYGPMPATFPAGGQANSYRFSLYATLLP